MTLNLPSANLPLILWNIEAWDAERNCWLYCYFTTSKREVAANMACALEYSSNQPFRVVRY